MRALIVVVGLLGAAAPVSAPTPRAQVSIASRPSPDLLKLASEVRRTGPKLATLWPGYWPPDQAFIIYRPGEGALLVGAEAAAEGFAPLRAGEVPKSLRGRAWFRPGELAGINRPFVLDHPIGGGRTAILVRADEHAEDLRSLIFHEQFHDYQQSAFKGRARSQFVAPGAVPDRVAFAAAAETERRVLAAALGAKPGKTRNLLLRQYLALRRERESRLAPNVLAVERQFETFEGTAKFIDRAAAALAPGAKKGVPALLAEVLGEDLGAVPQPYMTAWFRSRAYGIGAALTYFLRELDPNGWRSTIEGGAALDERLAALAGFDPAQDGPALARAARSAFGYEAIVAALAPGIRSAEAKEIKSVEEFHALGVHRLVFEVPAPKPGSRRAEMGFATGPGGMVLLSEANLVLPDPQMLSVKFPFGSLTVRGLPFMSESGATNRYTVLLPSAPPMNGLTGLSAGEHRFDRLEVEANGLSLSVGHRVTVVYSGDETTIRIR